MRRPDTAKYFSQNEWENLHSLTLYPNLSLTCSLSSHFQWFLWNLMQIALTFPGKLRRQYGNSCPNLYRSKMCDSWKDFHVGCRKAPFFCEVDIKYSNSSSCTLKFCNLQQHFYGLQSIMWKLPVPLSPWVQYYNKLGLVFIMLLDVSYLPGATIYSVAKRRFEFKWTQL